MSPWRDTVRSAARRLGYTVHRWPANRFDGMADALALLRRAGARPRVVVDAGAHVGAWTRLARPIFSEAAFHLVEPQPACQSALARLAAADRAITLHAVAVTEPGVARVRLIGTVDGGGTGARVALRGEEGESGIECRSATLDSLVGDGLTRRDRAVLKLDLEGHEMAALRGAEHVLEAVEVVLSEVQFFAGGGDAEGGFAGIHHHLTARGFALYDVACLSARPRDQRLRQGDVLFVRRDSPLAADRSWE
jgi:FkbM family methyltransferase